MEGNDHLNLPQRRDYGVGGLRHRTTTARARVRRANWGGSLRQAFTGASIMSTFVWRRRSADRRRSDQLQFALEILQAIPGSLNSAFVDMPTANSMMTSILRLASDAVQ